MSICWMHAKPLMSTSRPLMSRNVLRSDPQSWNGRDNRSKGFGVGSRG